MTPAETTAPVEEQSEPRNGTAEENVKEIRALLVRYSRGDIVAEHFIGLVRKVLET